MKREQSESRQSLGDVETLINNCAILTALVLAFVVGLAGNFDYSLLDRSNFREAYYDWPDQRFNNFIIHTLEQENYNFTVWLEIDRVIDVKSVLINRYEDVCKGDSDHECLGSVNMPYRNIEGVLDLIFPIFPMNKFRAFLDFHQPETEVVIDYSRNYYRFLAVSINLLVVTLLGAVALAVALALSDAREDPSGATLKKFNRFAIPLCILLYAMLLCATILFLIAVGGASSAVDSYLGRMQAFYTYFAFYFTIPLGVVSCVGSYALIKYCTMAKTDEDKGSLEL